MGGGSHHPVIIHDGPRSDRWRAGPPGAQNLRRLHIHLLPVLLETVRRYTRTTRNPVQGWPAIFPFVFWSSTHPPQCTTRPRPSECPATPAGQTIVLQYSASARKVLRGPAHSNPPPNPRAEHSTSNSSPRPAKYSAAPAIQNPRQGPVHQVLRLGR